MLTNLTDKFLVFSLTPLLGLVAIVGVMGLVLLVGFLTILIVVLGVRNRSHQPKCSVAGWMPFRMFFSPLVQWAPHGGIFCPWNTPPCSLLQQSWGERAEPAAQGRFAADDDGKETFNSGSPHFCWEHNRSSARTSWLSCWLHVALGA